MKKAHLLLSLLFLLSACTAAQTPTPTAAPAASATPTEQLVATASASATSSASPAGKVLDDFEAGNTSWQAGLPPDYPDSSALAAAITREYAAQGEQALALQFEKNDKPNAIFFLDGVFDLSADRYLAFALIDPQQAAGAVAIALSSGEDWYWHTSPAVLPRTDAMQLTFDLDAETFQTAATDWKPTAPLANRKDVRRVAILITPKTSGTVYVDTLRLLPDGALVSLPATVQPVAATATPGPCPGDAAVTPGDAALAIRLPAGATPVRGRLLEFDLQTSFAVDNPYDPGEIDLMVHYTAPDGTQFSIPAFWMQGFDPQSRRACGQAGWQARLNPTQAGQWTAQAEAVNRGLQSEAITFEVGEPDEAPLSLIRLHPTDSRYLARQDGTTFFPIGLNIGWWQNDPDADYSRWLDHFAPNGGNLIRVWMASWSFGIEWNDTGLGDYTNRQDRAWMLDQLFQLAAERGVYIDLVLINHGAFSASTNPEWANNPYNTVNGGMCDKPTCFATNAEAKEMFKRRVRYIAARWGYAPNLLAWEWWNEYNWTSIQDTDMAPWTQEMTAYLQQYDPYGHLVSTSTAGGVHPEVFNLPELDFLQHHTYTSVDPATDFGMIFKRYRQTIVPGKPVVFGEFGYDTGIEDENSFDETGIHLHNGLWAATFNQFASPAMYWWWDSYIEPLDLWWHFGALHRFIREIDLAQYTPLGPGKISVSDSANTILLALHSEESVLAWVRNKKYEAYSAQTERDKKVRYEKADPATWEYQLDALEGLTLTTTALPDGDYLVEWYDPQSGAWQTPSKASVKAGELAIDVPDFVRDVAVRIRPAP
ncbi:MAG: hypothetical protein ACOYYS_06670 [Chloroflexota bacterium]